jgi:hypothetical protein
MAFAMQERLREAPDFARNREAFGDGMRDGARRTSGMEVEARRMRVSTRFYRVSAMSPTF